ncbi:MAG: glycosyltransferase [Phycisphaerae bacterium]|nr:glycosyltransferase [Phycisphaerae bacterium]
MAKVTAIIPNYNHARYLRRRIESVLTQTFADLDVILMDDCSSDESRSILKEYAGNPQIQLMFNDRNSGSTFKQWNKGIASATTDYVWLAESDDYADPHFLERLVPLLENNSNVGIAYCESTVIDASDHVLRTTHDDYRGSNRSNRWRTDFIINGRQECADVFVRQNMIPNASAALFRRSLFNAIGGADESMRLCGDWKLWVGMLLRADLAHVADPLNYYRTHPDNVRSRARNWQIFDETLTIAALIDDALPVRTEDREFVRNRFADGWLNAWLHRDEFPAAMRYQLWQRLRQFDPTSRRRIFNRATKRMFSAARHGRFWRWTNHVIRRIVPHDYFP